MQQNNNLFLFVALAFAAVLAVKHWDQIRDWIPDNVPIPTPTPPLPPPSPEVQQLMGQLNGQIAGDDAKQLSATFAAAAAHALADGVAHNPPFIADSNDLKVRLENIGDLVCLNYRLGTKYPVVSTVLSAFLQQKCPDESAFNRPTVVTSLQTCADALGRL